MILQFIAMYFYKSILIFLLYFCLNLSTINAQVIERSGSDNVHIPDGGVVYIPIEIDEAPSHAEVIEVIFSLNVEHDSVSDVITRVGTDFFSGEDFWLYQTGDGPWLGYDQVFNGSFEYTSGELIGKSVNHTWYIVVDDTHSGNGASGRVTEWSIKIHYKTSPLYLDGFSEASFLGNGEYEWNVSYEGGNLNGRVCNDGQISFQWGTATQGEDYWFNRQPSSGSVSGGQCENVNISVSENPSTEGGRNSSITFYNISNSDNFESIIINQDRALTPAELVVTNHPGGSDNTYEVPPIGEQFTISFKNGGEKLLYWHADVSHSWIHLSNSSGGSNVYGELDEDEADYIRVTLYENDKIDTFSGYVDLFNMTEHAFRLYIVQDPVENNPAKLVLGTDGDQTISFEGGEKNVWVYNDGGETLYWHSDHSADYWIAVQPESGSVSPGSNQAVKIHASENPDSESRSHRVYFYNNQDSGNNDYVNVSQEARPIENLPPIAKASDITGQPSALYPNGLYSVMAEYYDPNGRDDIRYARLQLNNPAGSNIILHWDADTNEFYPWESDDGVNYVDTLYNVKVEPIANDYEGYRLTWEFVLEPN